MAEDYFDLSGFTDDDWKDLENPAPIPAGWYRAFVKEVDADANTNNVFLHFQVSAGKYAGKKIKETLWNPENADSDEKTANSRKKRILFASRLGLITAADRARKDPHFRVIWDNALNVEVWIKVKVKEFDRVDKVTKKPTGEKGTGNELEYGGIYPITDERVPEDVRNGTAKPPTATTTTQAAPARTTQASKPAPAPASANPVNIADLV